MCPRLSGGSFRGQSNRCRRVLAGPTRARFGVCRPVGDRSAASSYAVQMPLRYSVEELSCDSEFDICSLAKQLMVVMLVYRLLAESDIDPGAESGVLGYWRR